MFVHMNGGAVMDGTKIRIGEMSIGTFTGAFQISERERERIVAVCQKIWKHLRAECPGDKPIGLHRFDLVPQFARSSGKRGDLGELYVGGIYEVNGHSPECLAAASMIRNFYPHVECMNAAQKVAGQIKKTFGDQEIAFVIGYGSGLKEHWHKYLIQDLISAGLQITVMSPEEVMQKKPPLIWRWGDVRRDGENDYPRHNEFTQWLYQQDECTVFNRILASDEDPTNKSLLLSSADPDVAMLLGDNRNLDEESMWWSVDEHEPHGLMAKPNGGSSGKGLVFGEQHTTSSWIDALREKMAGDMSYSLWETQWLPFIDVKGERLAIDFNPAFWINGDVMTYLYTIIRVDSYTNYRDSRKINVSKGGGIAGLIY